MIEISDLVLSSTFVIEQFSVACVFANASKFEFLPWATNNDNQSRDLRWLSLSFEDYAILRFSSLECRKSNCSPTSESLDIRISISHSRSSSDEFDERVERWTFSTHAPIEASSIEISISKPPRNDKVESISKMTVSTIKTKFMIRLCCGIKLCSPGLLLLIFTFDK